MPKTLWPHGREEAGAALGVHSPPSAGLLARGGIPVAARDLWLRHRGAL